MALILRDMGALPPPPPPPPAPARPPPMPLGKKVLVAGATLLMGVALWRVFVTPPPRDSR
jgi:hypothetical protein